MPRLQVLNGKRQGAVFDVGYGAETLIGHRQSATIAIDDPWVSWDHARLFFNGDGGCWIEDLGSTNGTFVNCVRVKREVLRHEDIIFLGKTHVIFLSPAEEHSGGSAFAGDDPFSSAPAVQTTAANPFAPPVIQSPSSSFQSPQLQHPVHLPSSAGPFRSDSGTPPLRDPFASGGTPASAWPAPQKAKKDPFADSSVDPFSSGPDFAARPLVPPPGPTPSQVDPGRARRAFADTNADDEVLGPPPQPPSGQPRKLSISELNEDLGAATKTTPVHEISQLIEGYDDLDTILGDGRARTPDPAFARPQPRLGQPSEMRTRPIDTDAAREILAEEDRRGPVAARSSARQVPPTVGLPAVNFEPSSANAAPILPPVSTAAPRPQTDLYRAPPPPPPPAEAARPASASGGEDTFPGPQILDPGALAFERARLEDEVRRLRAAMQAAREKSPQAIKVAAEALRDLELGRLARKVAELERDMVRLRNELAEKQAELDGVTDEMIEKEDRIDGLEAELRRARGARAQALGASTDADLGAM